jgi:hypothetical protein
MEINTTELNFIKKTSLFRNGLVLSEEAEK